MHPRPGDLICFRTIAGMFLAVVAAYEETLKLVNVRLVKPAKRPSHAYRRYNNEGVLPRLISRLRVIQPIK